jgi:GMP synthase-like glutamine amidotransferase
MQDVAVLGVCFGMQLMAVVNGGIIKRLEYPHKGGARISFTLDTVLGAPHDDHEAFFNHQDVVTHMPANFLVDGYRNDDGVIASFHSQHMHRFGVQFHPEESTGQCGPQLLERFIRVAQRGRVCLHGDTRISRDTFARVAMQMGHRNAQSVSEAYGLDLAMVVMVWTRFRKMYDIPAMMF